MMMKQKEAALAERNADIVVLQNNLSENQMECDRLKNNLDLIKEQKKNIKSDSARKKWGDINS